MASHHLPYSQRRTVRQLGFPRPINCVLDPNLISGVLSREIFLDSYTGVSMVNFTASYWRASAPHDRILLYQARLGGMSRCTLARSRPRAFRRTRRSASSTPGLCGIRLGPRCRRARFRNKRRFGTISHNDRVDVHNAIERMKTRWGSGRLSLPRHAGQPTLLDRGDVEPCPHHLAPIVSRWHRQ